VLRTNCLGRKRRAQQAPAAIFEKIKERAQQAPVEIFGNIKSVQHKHQQQFLE
jgi:hypothetical protein